MDTNKNTNVLNSKQNKRLLRKQKQERKNKRLQEIWEMQKNKADRDALFTQTEILANFARVYEVTGNEVILKFLNRSINSLIPEDMFEESPLDSILEEIKEKMSPEEIEQIKEVPVLNEDKATEIVEMPDGVEVEFDVEDVNIDELSEPEVVDLDD